MFLEAGDVRLICSSLKAMWEWLMLLEDGWYQRVTSRTRKIKKDYQEITWIISLWSMSLRIKLQMKSNTMESISLQAISMKWDLVLPFNLWSYFIWIWVNYSVIGCGKTDRIFLNVIKDRVFFQLTTYNITVKSNDEKYIEIWWLQDCNYIHCVYYN